MEGMDMRIIACAASSLDGKIDLYHDKSWRFGSNKDLNTLISLRDQVDATLCGGATFRQWPLLRQGNKSIPMQCILTSNYDNIEMAEGIFRQKHPHQPLYVYHCGKELLSLKTGCYPINKKYMAQNIVKDLDSKWNKKSLLLEGGGKLIGQFIEARLLNELYLTITPHIFGGNLDSPLVLLEGYTRKTLPNIEILESEISKEAEGMGEIYLHLKFNYTTTQTDQKS